MAGLALLLLGFPLDRPALFFTGGLLLAVDSALPMFVRCRMSGLRTWTSSTALRFGPADRVSWLRSLETCPVCGDDGRAKPESRESWLSSGAVPERPYWSAARVVWAIVLTAILAAGGFAIGLLYRLKP